MSPLLIICPRCDDVGRINAYHPDSSDRSRRAIVITHGKMAGTYGRNKRVRKRFRCYFPKINTAEEKSLRQQLQEKDECYQKQRVFHALDRMCEPK